MFPHLRERSSSSTGRSFSATSGDHKTFSPSIFSSELKTELGSIPVFCLHIEPWSHPSIGSSQMREMFDDCSLSAIMETWHPEYITLCCCLSVEDLNAALSTVNGGLSKDTARRRPPDVFLLKMTTTKIYQTKGLTGLKACSYNTLRELIRNQTDKWHQWWKWSLF